MSKEKDPWVRIINVSDPFRHKKGYTLYKVTSKVFPKNSIEAISEVIVWKRYNEFKKLYKALFSIHQSLYLKDTFPFFAKARFFDRFDESVIEERRLSALNLLQFAAKHPPLFTSQVFVKFFEDGHIIEHSSHVDLLTNDETTLQPSKLENFHTLQSNFLNSENENYALESKNSYISLGGTWHHHQIADTFSINSQNTEDEDDCTILTNDDSISVSSVITLEEFDPLLKRNFNDTPENNLFLNSHELDNNWLLSALQSCGKQNSEPDFENIEFPKPFIDIEFADDTDTKDATNFLSIPSTKDTNTSSKDLKSLHNENPIVKALDEKNYKCNMSSITSNSFGFEDTSYVKQAANFICLAHAAESNQNFKAAFELYKQAIDVLLNENQGHNSSHFKENIQKKVLLYLTKAEEIYENKLRKVINDVDYQEVDSTSSLSYPFSNGSTILKGCVDELNKFKVLGILNKVLLVLDTSSNLIYIMKTLYKSSNKRKSDSPDIVPENIPYMVKLFQVYETNYALFLILEHATGGCLWNYVSSYLNHNPLSLPKEETISDETRKRVELSNVYSGKKIKDSEVMENKYNIGSKTLDSDLIASNKSPSSYIALFKKYASTFEEKDIVSLAHYRNSTYSNEKCVKTNSFTKIKTAMNISPKKNDTSASLFSDLYKSVKKIMPNKTSLSLNTNGRNQLSTSTGSIETALSQKTHFLEVLPGLDNALFLASSKPNHLPESCLNLWAAEIVIALESLHKLGIIWMDLHPDNILLGKEGHILLTYKCLWNCVDNIINESAQENFYCAPEIGRIFPISSECDWWSLGAILYELLTGQSLISCHPTGITEHTVLNFPIDLSLEAKDFLSKLLQFNPKERLGSGVYGVEEIKSHPFFRSIEWNTLYQN